MVKGTERPDWVEETTLYSWSLFWDVLPPSAHCAALVSVNPVPSVSVWHVAAEVCSFARRPKMKSFAFEVETETAGVVVVPVAFAGSPPLVSNGLAVLATADPEGAERVVP